MCTRRRNSEAGWEPARSHGWGRGRAGSVSAALVASALVAWPATPVAAAQALLVPMDERQQNHLKAYGLVYQALAAGERAEWLLNYRAGSFLLPEARRTVRRAALMGVTVERLDGEDIVGIRARIAESNMESVLLETAPRVAVYAPPTSSPWDDAVSLALEYAEIPYVRVWDEEVISASLSEYDWLHLHHEDFTGQYSKFFLGYAGSDWLRAEKQRNEALAERLGFADVPAMKKRVAQRIREYVVQGGLLFAMCTATETLDLALAAEATDIAAAYADGSPPRATAADEMHWELSLAFENAELVLDPSVSAYSDIDGHQVNTPWRRPLGSFALFDFSAKIDPVPTMLTQAHERVLPDFYGLTTSFRTARLKPGIVTLANDETSGLVKYLHGPLGLGSFTFLGGHDPEDPEHLIGDPPTDLELHRNSAGYRLILNNVLYPAAKRQALKT